MSSKLKQHLAIMLLGPLFVFPGGCAFIMSLYFIIGEDAKPQFLRVLDSEPWVGIALIFAYTVGFLITLPSYLILRRLKRYHPFALIMMTLIPFILLLVTGFHPLSTISFAIFGLFVVLGMLWMSYLVKVRKLPTPVLST